MMEKTFPMTYGYSKKFCIYFVVFSVGTLSRYDYEHNRKKIIEWLYSSPSIKRHISILADKAPRKLIDEIVEVGVTVAAYFKEIFLAIQDRLRET